METTQGRRRSTLVAHKHPPCESQFGPSRPMRRYCLEPGPALDPKRQRRRPGVSETPEPSLPPTSQRRSRCPEKPHRVMRGVRANQEAEALLFASSPPATSKRDPGSARRWDRYGPSPPRDPGDRQSPSIVATSCELPP